MKLVDLSAFDVATENMEWPWIAFDATGSHIAYPKSASQVATLHYDGERVAPGSLFTLPPEVPVFRVQSLALRRDATELAAVALVEKESVLLLCAPNETARSANLRTQLGEGFVAQAVSYDRKGERIWISAESATASVVVLLDAASLVVLGSSLGRTFPPPAMHELYIHPVDDAVLLLASCGQEGTFARVVGFAGESVEAIATRLDDGAVAAGFVGFSADATRVHLAEADELRTHAWPGLDELSSTELADDFISNYSGAVFGDNILVDGQVEGGADDAVMQFDKSAIYGTVVSPPVPLGMWAGRLGRDAVVTVDPKTSPRRGRITRVRVVDIAH